MKPIESPSPARTVTALLLLCLLLVVSPAARAFADPPPGDSWTLLWGDEFDGSSIDTSKWLTTYAWGDRTNAGNDELEWYTDDAVQVSNGTLKLVATTGSPEPGYPYSSGMIAGSNVFSQMYGYFEARIKVPKGKGLWPAFWLLPSPLAWPPEIDVMEILGHDPKTVYMTNHWANEYPLPGQFVPGGSDGGSYVGSDASAGFHVYGVKWTPTDITWYIDGVQRYHTTSHPPIAGYGTQGMYVILDLAVGGSWPGSPDSTTVFPAQMEVDYVRVYQRGAADLVAPTASLTNITANQDVHDALVVDATAADNVGISAMGLYVDGVAFDHCLVSYTPCEATWDSTTVPNGPHVVEVRATDSWGNGVSDTRVVNVANVPRPVCSLSADPTTINLGDVALLSWTSTNADEMSLDHSLGAVPAASGTVTVSPAISTTYTATVTSDAAGIQATCAVTVAVIQPDTKPPVVALTAPANQSTVSGTVTVSASASDNTGVAGVQFQIDGTAIGAEVLAAPYSVAWDSRSVANGTHSLAAVARDAAGNRAVSASRTVTVNNDQTPPSVSITAPAANARVSGTITVSASASDNKGVAGVQFQLDGVALGAEDQRSPYSTSWNTTTVSNGAHQLSALARDAAGNTAIASAVTVTVVNDRTPPTVVFTAPAPGAAVAGSVVVSVDASDDVGVSGVQFKLDGNNLGAEDTTAPYAVSWNSLASPNGAHTLTAVARDAAGNLTTATMAVTVNNVDTTPPAVSITAPGNGAIVSGSIAVSASASDNVGVVGVQFWLDGQPLGAEDTSAPYSITWNAATVATGTHVLTATARDAAGLTASSAVSVTVAQLVTYVPVSLSVTSGTIQSGSVASVASDDNVYLVVRSTTNPGSRQSSVTFTYTGVLTPSRLDVAVRLKGSTTITTTIQIYNASSRSWVTLSSSSTGTSETQKSASITSVASQYVSGGTLQLRVSSSAFASNTVSIDSVAVTAQP